MRALADLLAKNRATMTCQFDAFAGAVTEAEEQGAESYPLYRGQGTIEHLAKRTTELKSFAIYLDGKEVYAKRLADTPLQQSSSPCVCVAS